MIETAFGAPEEDYFGDGAGGTLPIGWAAGEDADGKSRRYRQSQSMEYSDPVMDADEAYWLSRPRNAYCFTRSYLLNYSINLNKKALLQLANQSACADPLA